MTNPYTGLPTHADLSMPTGTSGFTPRRTSYASVVSGTASGAPQAYQQPSRSGAFAHLLNHNSDSYYDPHSHSFGGYSRYDSRGGEMDYHANGGGHGRTTSWGGRGAQLPSFSSAFGSIMNANAYGNGTAAADYFFVPSYLKGSKYVQKLEEAHNAKIAARKEAHSAPTSQPGSLSTSASSVNLHAKLAPSYRGMTYDLIEKAPPIEDETLAPLPTCWNTHDKQVGLEVVGDGLEVKFTGPKHDREREHEAWAIRADHPMPPRCGIYYFEVSIASRKREESSIGIGFSSSKVPLTRLPGWEPDSWAYHGDDGHSYCCQTSGKHYGPPFSSGDIIGCGVNFRTGCAFFTKNGDHLGTAFRDIKGKLYPSVGMKKSGEHITVNFGQRPFVFDIDGMMSASNFSYSDSPSPNGQSSLPLMNGNGDSRRASSSSSMPDLVPASPLPQVQNGNLFDSNFDRSHVLLNGLGSSLPQGQNGSPFGLFGRSPAPYFGPDSQSHSSPLQTTSRGNNGSTQNPVGPPRREILLNPDAPPFRFADVPPWTQAQQESIIAQQGSMLNTQGTAFGEHLSAPSADTIMAPAPSDSEQVFMMSWHRAWQVEHQVEQHGLNMGEATRRNTSLPITESMTGSLTNQNDLERLRAFFGRDPQQPQESPPRSSPRRARATMGQRSPVPLQLPGRQPGRQRSVSARGRNGFRAATRFVSGRASNAPGPSIFPELWPAQAPLPQQTQSVSSQYAPYGLPLADSQQPVPVGDSIDISHPESSIFSQPPQDRRSQIEDPLLYRTPETVAAQIEANLRIQREKNLIHEDIVATKIERLAPPLNETELVQSLVLQFLTHDGYVETARAFAEEIQTEKKALSLDPNAVISGYDLKEDEDAGHRQKIRTAILDGDIEKALKYTNAYYPHVLKENEHVYFRLRCRKFIEMIRQGADMANGTKKSNGHSGDWYDDIINHQDMDLDEHQPSSNNWDKMDTEETPTNHYDLTMKTLEYGRALETEFKDDPRREIRKALDDAFALMAYTDPTSAKDVGYLLDPSERVPVAEELNSAILQSLGKSSSAALERLIQQTTVLLEDLREGGGPGAFVNIDDFSRPKTSL